MNRFGKLLLVVTSLAPVLGAYAVNSLSNEEYLAAGWYAFICISLAVICLLIVHGCDRHLPRETLPVRKVVIADKQTLTFLVIYLLPMATKGIIAMEFDFLMAVYVFGVIGIAVYHSNAFTFNPILAFCGYHFYEVESQGGMTYLLLTKRIIRSQTEDISVVGISDYVYLESA